MKKMRVISVLVVIMEVDIGVLMMENLRLILELIMVDVDLGLKIPSTFHLTIQDRLLVVMVELDIGPRPATIPPK